MRVLLVEDQDVLRRVLARSLRARADVDEAERLHDAFDRVRRTNYDVVITDDELPDGSGRVLLERVRAFQSGCRRALMSGSDVRLEPNVEPAYERFFQKPTDLPALIEWVDALRAGVAR